MHWKKTNRWGYIAAIVLTVILLTAGCGGKTAAPAAEQASEDMTEAAQTAKTEETAVPEEEEKLTVENALVGICVAGSETGNNEFLFRVLQDELVLRGFATGNIVVQDLTDRNSVQEKVDECLSRGCTLLIVSAVDNADIPKIADKVTDAGAGAVFLNCIPGDDEILRWTEENRNAVWIDSGRTQQIAVQMNILYDYSGTDRGLDFNEDGHVGALLVGGSEEARTALEETVRDLGSELQILGETDSEEPEEISAYTQEILNAYKKEAELVLCSTESAALAAADGVQLRHRLVGRDILVIGVGAHDDTCTAIINKLMSGSTSVDFYEQAKLIAVAAKDMVEGNQDKKVIADVLFKVTEENAQEVLDQLWKIRNESEEGENAGTDGTGTGG